MLNNINIVNLAFAKDVQVKKESSFNPPPLPSLNLNRVCYYSPPHNKIFEYLIIYLIIYYS